MNKSEHNELRIETFDKGVRALGLVARFHNIHADVLTVARQISDSALTVNELLLCAKRIGLKAALVSVPKARLEKISFPAIVASEDGDFYVAGAASQGSVLVMKSGQDSPTFMTIDELHALGRGRMLLFSSRAAIYGELAKFDFSWFIPSIIKYRHLFLEVILVSILLQCFGLVTPLVFQVVTDKVLTSRAESTLMVAVIALAFSGVFDTLFTAARNYVLSHTTNRIDVELGAKLFNHLVHLPMSYYWTRRAGDIISRVKEIENIRSFLTGSSLTAVIDVLFSVIFIVVMFFYNVKLTMIVLLCVPCYALISLTAVPSLRKKLQVMFSRNADVQSFLVETVGGIETIKSLSLETSLTRQWNVLLANFAAAGFAVNRSNNFAQQSVQLVSKLTSAASLYFGAQQVIAGHMSIGQLVAFNMLLQHIAAPVLRMTQLSQELQQAGLSVQRLGDVLNVRTENFNPSATAPNASGTISFERVSFRYSLDTAPVLNNLNMEIAAGRMTAIVGTSGCGKSTISKLIQGLVQPESGKVVIGGTDVAAVDRGALRRQIGVVLQESFLFNRSIKENILAAHSTASFEQVVRAATDAGAHDFITALPDGYETVVGERGSTLSGGQRQRIAIARALLGNPRLIIFDEATSSLDVETEQIIDQRMRSIMAGRTSIIISHRLSSIAHADHIVVMDRGEIAEQGTHAELLAARAKYSQMWDAQSRIGLAA